MNRRKIFLVWSLMLAIVNASAYAAPPASVSKQKQAEYRTTFNKVTDFFATLGKSEDETRELVQDRTQDRAAARLSEDDRRKKRAIKRRMKAQEKLIMEKEDL